MYYCQIPYVRHSEVTGRDLTDPNEGELTNQLVKSPPHPHCFPGGGHSIDRCVIPMHL